MCIFFNGFLLKSVAFRWTSYVIKQERKSIPSWYLGSTTIWYRIWIEICEKNVYLFEIISNLQVFLFFIRIFRYFGNHLPPCYILAKKAKTVVIISNNLFARNTARKHLDVYSLHFCARIIYEHKLESIYNNFIICQLPTNRR